MENDLLFEYREKFGEMPPLMMEFPYTNEYYQNWIKQAIDNGKPLTDEEVERLMDENEIEVGVINKKPMEQNNGKIEKLLAKYGADEEEIKNFMKDLAEMKDDIEEMGDMQEDENKGQDEYNDFAENNNLDENDNKLKEIAKDEEQHEDFLLNAQNVALLKATQEGKELLINAPTMAKDELEKAIKEYLLKNKGE